MAKHWNKLDRFILFVCVLMKCCHRKEGEAHAKNVTPILAECTDALDNSCFSLLVNYHLRYYVIRLESSHRCAANLDAMNIHQRLKRYLPWEGRITAVRTRLLQETSFQHFTLLWHNVSIWQIATDLGFCIDVSGVSPCHSLCRGLIWCPQIISRASQPNTVSSSILLNNRIRRGPVFKPPPQKKNPKQNRIWLLTAHPMPFYVFFFVFGHFKTNPHLLQVFRIFNGCHLIMTTFSFWGELVL